MKKRKGYTTNKYTLTAAQAADFLGYHEQYVRILARKGKLPAIKQFRKWLFCAEELTEHFEDYTKKTLLEERHAKNDRRSAKTSDLFL